MNHSLFYGSSYDRSLQQLLEMWPDIIKRFPKTKLHICYGWDLFVKAHANNPERMMWKDNMDKLMKQKGITHHGRVGKKELGDVRKKCTIWAYPTAFTEIHCITAYECQNDGLVPVVTNVAALATSVGAGYKIDGDIYDPEVRKEFLDRLLGLMADDDLWAQEAQNARDFATSNYWPLIAKKWIDYVSKKSK